MVSRWHQDWPFASSLRLSSMGLLAVVLSTFVAGWFSTTLLVAAALLTTYSVVRFAKALRQVRHGAPPEAPSAAEELRPKDYA